MCGGEPQSNSESPSEEEEELKRAVCDLCDCCQDTTIKPCKIYLWIYIGVFLLLILSMAAYQKYKIRLNALSSKNRVSKKKFQSKLAIVVCVNLWIITRIMYFSVSYL